MKNKSFNFSRMMLLSLIAGGLVTPFQVSAEKNSIEHVTAVSAVDQQQDKIKGLVLDLQTREPIIGANVFYTDNSTGTITNVDGEYELEAPVGAKLTISYLGYQTQVVTATKGIQKIFLTEDAELLDEVVVVGYAVQKKESLTGSMQVIKSDKLKDVTSPSVENMLSSKAPGVYVAPGSGQPGSVGAVQIRGKSTINGSTNPLWVVDGVIMGDSPASLNPADIESMSILKDAASTAIYGSQGANGVIVVTTKKARGESISINFSSKVGITRLNTGRLKMMDGAELYDYYSSFENVQQVENNPVWSPALRDKNFDWWDYATHTGLAQDYNLSLNGGTEKLKSFFSAGVYDENGAVRGYDFRKYSFRFKAEYTPFSILTIRPNVSGSRSKVLDQQHSVSAMYTNFPWDAPYDANGNIYDHRPAEWFNSNKTNYVKDIDLNKLTSNRYELIGGLDFTLKILPYLTFTSTNNYRWSNYSRSTYTDPKSSGGESVHGRINEYDYHITKRYTNQLLNFTKTFGKHNVTALLGYEYNDYKYKVVDVSGTGFVPGFEVLDVVSMPEATKGGMSDSAMQSIFVNTSYAYDGRYLGQVSFRRDGASNFGDNAKYGNFYSLSAGWNMQNEKWFKLDFVDELKLRASFGTVGNRPSQLYPQYDLYSASYSYDGDPGLLLSQIGNKDLTWEKTYTTGIGFDLSLFQRLRLNVDYYYKITDNMLYRVPVSGVTGVTGIWKNIGKIQNQGIEVTIGGDLISRKDMLWSMDLNLSHNKNKVKELYGTKSEIIVSDVLNASGTADKILKKGYDSDTYYVKEWAGVNPDDGSPMWYKNTTNADGTINRETTSRYNEATEVAYTSSAPKIFGGLSTSFKWKDLDVSANFGFSFGGHIYNYSRTEYDSDGKYTDRNQMKLKSGWNRWEKPGDIATHPKAMYQNTSNSNLRSSRFIESSNYIKLRTLTVGYNFQLPKYYISNLRLFVTGENLFTITPYSGVDPEIPIIDGKISGSAGPSVYPSVRKFMFGLNLTL